MSQSTTDQNPSDVKLVEDCITGSTEAFGLVVDRYQKPIFNLCLRMLALKEDAADLTQETFLNAFQNLSSYNPNQKFFTWLYTIALNLCRNHLKRKNILRFFSLNQAREDGNRKQVFDPPSQSPSPQDNFESKEKDKFIKSLIDTLPPSQKSLMLLKLNDHLSDSEISKVCGVSENNVRVQIHQAKLKLFEEYKKRILRG